MVKDLFKVRLALANFMPFLGFVRRWLRAFIDSNIPLRSSYSQHFEDKLVLKLLAKFDLKNALYVDVGASHPTSLSNSYLLYRKGIRGIIIDPNLEFQQLYHAVRANDIAIPIGCGREVSLRRFYMFSTPVCNTFSETEAKRLIYKNKRLLRVVYVPVLPLDLILKRIQHEWICFLSIDTEDFDLEVLSGSLHTLDKTLLLCIEANDTESEKRIFEFLKQKNFELVQRYDFNLLFRNTNESFQRYLA